MAGPFRPDHRSPASGLSAWDAPDPARQPVATVAAGLEMQVVERHDAWAMVLFDNGWTGWVDGRLLEPIAPAVVAPPRTPAPPPAALPPAASTAPAPPSGTPAAVSNEPVSIAGVRVTAALVGGALVLVATFLPWVGQLGLSENGFGVPVNVLYDPETQDPSPIKLGFLLLVAGALIVATAIGRLPRQVGRVAGGAAVVVTTLFVGQLQRALGQAQAASVFGVLGMGVYLTMVGGVIAAMSKGSES